MVLRVSQVAAGLGEDRGHLSRQGHFTDRRKSGLNLGRQVGCSRQGSPHREPAAAVPDSSKGLDWLNVFQEQGSDGFPGIWRNYCKPIKSPTP